MGGQPGLFDVEERLRDLSAKGDDLERIAALVDFELFRTQLQQAVPRSDGSKGGRPGFDHVLMFKVLLLQAMHALAELIDRLGLGKAEHMAHRTQRFIKKEQWRAVDRQRDPGQIVVHRRGVAALVRAAGAFNDKRG